MGELSHLNIILLLFFIMRHYYHFQSSALAKSIPLRLRTCRQSNKKRLFISAMFAQCIMQLAPSSFCNSTLLNRGPDCFAKEECLPLFFLQQIISQDKIEQKYKNYLTIVLRPGAYCDDSNRSKSRTCVFRQFLHVHKRTQ